MGKSANEIFKECENFTRYFKLHNQSIADLIDNPNKKDIERYIESNDELIELTKFRIGQLEDTLSQVGWWRKKVANSYIKQIQNGFHLSQWGLVLLKKKINT